MGEPEAIQGGMHACIASLVPRVEPATKLGKPQRKSGFSLTELFSGLVSSLLFVSSLMSSTSRFFSSSSLMSSTRRF